MRRKRVLSTPKSLIQPFGFLLLLLFIPPASAWKTGYHAQICESALLQAENTKIEKEPFLAGCKAPDLEREAYPPHHLTKDISRIENQFLLSKEDFEKGGYERSSFQAGVVAHYIADFASPAHNGADPDCHTWIEDTKPEIYLVSAEKKTIEIKELLESTANNSRQYAQEFSNYCAKNDTTVRDKLMGELASYSTFNTALMLDSLSEYAPPQKTEMEKYALTDYPAVKKEEKSYNVLAAILILAALALIIRKA